MLQTIATIASDMATMIQIVSMDMDREQDMDEIEPMPASNAPQTGHANEGRAVEPADEQEAPCESASSARPPRRRRVPQQSVPKATPKRRPCSAGASRNVEVKPKATAKPKPDPKMKLARPIEIAPWRTKIARQRWLIKKRPGRRGADGSCAVYSKTARSST